MGTATTAIETKATAAHTERVLTMDELSIEIQAISEDAQRIGNHIGSKDREELMNGNRGLSRRLQLEHNATAKTVRDAGKYLQLSKQRDELRDAASA